MSRDLKKSLQKLKEWEQRKAELREVPPPFLTSRQVEQILGCDAWKREAYIAFLGVCVGLAIASYIMEVVG